MEFDSYENVVRFFIDSYNFCTIDKPMYVKSIHTNSTTEVAYPSSILVNYLTSSYYYINDNPKTVFHDKNIVNFLENYQKKVQVTSLQDAISSDKSFVLQIGIHPCNMDDLFNGLFFKLLSDGSLVNRLRNRTAFLFIDYSYEADIFYEPAFNKTESHYNLFLKVLEDYDLPKDSIIFLNSNTNRNITPKFEEDGIKTIFESALQSDTFKNNFVDVDYSVEQYLDNIRKQDINRVLRVNRTHQISRDLMLYYLVQSGNIKNTLTEHNGFLNSENINDEDSNYRFKSALEEVNEAANNLDLDISEYLNYSEDSIKNILKMIPLRASEYERINGVSSKTVYSNTPIPPDVYKSSILSWVSTSLFERSNQVFHNQSIFAPMLYYHPLVIAGNPWTHHFLLAESFHDYDWISNQTLVDRTEQWSARLATSIYEIHKIYNMDKDHLIKLISDNHGSLNYNRQQLFQCNPIKSIFYNLVEIIAKYKVI